MLGVEKVGHRVGRHWVRAGHAVLFGANDPRELHAWVGDLGPNARLTSLVGAAEADVVLVAVPFREAPGLYEALSAQLAGKVVIDATHPVRFDDRGRLVHALGVHPTAGERTSRLLPRSLVARSFTHIPEELLTTRAFAEPVRWAMGVSADDDRAHDVTSDLVRDCGFTPVSLGRLADSGPMDPEGPLFPHLYTEADLRRILARVGGKSDDINPTGGANVQ
ncbi:NADPH-dependent F420 reductase [Streptomyces sp. cg2]|uniref:NADPH-dependent F420 reductase n=1 Tax=Streptomyces sp. cg2 TaxID=3238799 RepID=UPI0034E24FF3